LGTPACASGKDNATIKLDNSENVLLFILVSSFEIVDRFSTSRLLRKTRNPVAVLSGQPAPFALTWRDDTRLSKGFYQLKGKGVPGELVDASEAALK
jgi:hypothetical protein